MLKHLRSIGSCRWITGRDLCDRCDMFVFPYLRRPLFMFFSEREDLVCDKLLHLEAQSIGAFLSGWIL